ncbi:MAG: Gfo/Idh/MocA family oxidoreductase [Nitrososphaeraceae archaeon]
MRFLVIGCGSIGERHIMNLSSILSDARIDVCDSQPERLKAISEKYSVNTVNHKALDSIKYDCVLICTPPLSHIDLAIRALNTGSNVFIEKPLSQSSDGTELLRNLIQSKRLLAFVAYNLRFNRGISVIKEMIDNRRFGRIVHASAYFGQYLPDWRPWQDYKKSYTARKELGGGIIQDGSHELDYMKWLFGIPIDVQSQFTVTNILEVDSEAIADILLRFDKDILGHIHLDFVRREYRRTLELLTENGLIQWSLSDSSIKTFDASSRSWSTIKLEETVNDMYKEEIKHLIKCIETQDKSDIIDLENGISTLSLSEAVYNSGLSGRRISFTF